MMTSFMDEFRFLDKSDPDLLICGRHEYCHKVLLKADFNLKAKSHRCRYSKMRPFLNLAMKIRWGFKFQKTMASKK